MANANEKQIAFYMTKRSAKELDEIQEIFAKEEGRVTKAYVLNQAIYHYYEYIKEHYGELEDEDEDEEKEEEEEEKEEKEEEEKEEEKEEKEDKN